MNATRSLVGGLAVLLLTIWAVGCGNQANAPAKTDPKASLKAQTPKATDQHAHGNGPHDGVVADWGGGAYHVEFTVDHDKKEATVYVLGSDGKSPAPVKTSKLLLSINDPQFQVDLAAEPLEGETGGASSRFVGKHDSLGKVKEFAGTITGEVDGTPYAGDFKEEPHGAQGNK